MNGYRRLDIGGVLFGLILLIVGSYFILKNTLGLEIPELKWDMIWPLFIVALGTAVIWNNVTRDQGAPR